MLVEYTPISTLSAEELRVLQARVRGLTLEASTPAFHFNGKIISTRELIAQKQIWEGAQRNESRQSLFE